MDQPIEITTLSEASWSEFRALRLRALREEPQAFALLYEAARVSPDELWRERLRAAADGRSWLIFARLGGQLVGMVGAFRGDDDHTRDRATLFGTYVDPTARNHGIGQRMLSALLARLALDGEVITVRLAVNPDQLAAVRLYESAGFGVVGEDVAILGDSLPHRELIMEKSLI